MSVAVLLVTHGKLGGLLVETTIDMIGPLPLRTGVLEVERMESMEATLSRGQKMVHELDNGDGVLVLSDVYGSTPGNIAMRLADRPDTEMVAGINLPMLIRIFNYPNYPLSAMAENAVQSGRRGVFRGVSIEPPDEEAHR